MCSIYTNNHYSVPLKLVYGYMSVIPLIRKKNWGIENGWFKLGSIYFRIIFSCTEKSKVIVTYKTKLYFHAKVHREAVQDWEISFMKLETPVLLFCWCQHLASGNKRAAFAPVHLMERSTHTFTFKSRKTKQKWLYWDVIYIPYHSPN